MSTIPDSPIIVFPERCPGCEEDFDPRYHTEKWCHDCKPEDGSHGRWPTGDCDRQARAIDLHGGNSDTSPENQRAAAALWGAQAGPIC